IKFSIYTFPGEQHELSGELSRIGQPDGAFRVRRAGGETVVDQKPALPDHAGAFKLLLVWLGEQTKPDAVGHRIVHGGPDYRDPQIVSPDVISRLRELIPLAPNHLPRELDAIELISRSYANVPQVGCFDTAFHRGMPEIAQVYALPESVRQEGVVLRYGF